MPCENPQAIHLYKLRDGTSGAHFFGSASTYLVNVEMGLQDARDDIIFVPCGKCLSCRMMAAKHWCLRCKDELTLHQDACFLTLTYNDEHLPDGANLFKPDYQKFFKRLRKSLSKAKKVCPHLDMSDLRYFGCGEYGRENLRPHYHFIIFGWSPKDIYPWSHSGRALCYRSPFLDALWSEKNSENKDVPIGYATVGMVTEESINYVCRYNLKKLDLDTSAKDVPPFTVCSSRPAIGKRWFDKYCSELLVKDGKGVIVRYGHFDGRHFVSPPRYYTKGYTDEDKEALREFVAASNVAPDLVDLARQRGFNRYRSAAYSTHFGLDVLALVPETPIEEKSEDE